MPMVCKYFVENRCEKGSSCPFRHIRPSSVARGRGQARAHQFIKHDD
jgi:hypothetical protein